jgi:hypothetical protein
MKIQVFMMAALLSMAASLNALGATFEKAKFAAQLDGKITEISKEEAFLGGISWFIRAPYVDFGLGAGAMLNSTAGLSSDAVENSGNITYGSATVEGKVFDSKYVQLGLGLSRGIYRYSWDVPRTETSYSTKSITESVWEYGPSLVVPASFTSVKIGYSRRVLATKTSLDLAKRLQGSSYQLSFVNYF